MKKIIATILLFSPLTAFGLTTKETIDNYDFFFVDGDIARVYNKEEKISITNEAGIFLDDFYNQLKNGGSTRTETIVVNELSTTVRRITKDFELQGLKVNFNTGLNDYYDIASKNIPGYPIDYVYKTVTNTDIDDFIRQIIIKEALYGIDGIQAILEIRDYISYTADLHKYLGYDYYAKPIETLVEGAEDCDGLSILIGTLLERYSELGGYYDIDVIFVEFEDHLALAVNSSNYYMSGTYYLFNNKNYYILETTNSTYGIGDWYDTTRNEATLRDLTIKYN